MLILILLASTLTAISQEVPFPLDSATKKINYTKVVELQGEKQQLFDKAVDWFALSFKSAKDVLQIKDKEAGKIVGSFTIYASEGGPVTANIIILLKDGKYKYSITDLVFAGSRSFKPWALEEDPNPWSVGLAKRGIRFIKENTHQRALLLASSLENSMKKPSIADNF